MTFGSPMATEGAITPKTVRPKSEVNIRYAAFLEEFLQRRLRALDAYREERSFFCYKFPHGEDEFSRGVGIGDRLRPGQPIISPGDQPHQVRAAKNFVVCPEGPFASGNGYSAECELA